ncbi:MAG TPA: hypothetical protein VFH51_10380 [Myxococcota bacterium]|nr:hypothetical protein [Myxococcota bacterium]
MIVTPPAKHTVEMMALGGTSLLLGMLWGDWPSWVAYGLSGLAIWLVVKDYR